MNSHWTSLGLATSSKARGSVRAGQCVWPADVRRGQGDGREARAGLSELLPHGLISSSHPMTHTDKAAAGVAPMRTHREEAGGPESRTQMREGRLVRGPRQRQEESRDQGAWSRQAALLDPTCLPGWDSQVRTRHLLGMRRARGPPGHPSLPQEGPRRPGTGGAQSRWAGSWDRVQGGLPTHAVLQPRPGGRQSLEGSPGAHDGSGNVRSQPIEDQGRPPRSLGVIPRFSTAALQDRPLCLPSWAGGNPQVPPPPSGRGSGGLTVDVGQQPPGRLATSPPRPSRPPEEPAAGRSPATPYPERRGPRFCSQSCQRPLQGRAIFSHAKNSLC